MPNRRNAIYFFIILCLLGGLFTGRAFLFNLAAILGGMLIFALIWAWLSLRAIRISRYTTHNRVAVGGQFNESFTLHNRAFLPKLFVDVRDESTLPYYRASHVVPWLFPRAGYRWTASVACYTRGEYRLGPINVTSGDPFGLFTLTRHVAATSSVLVFPQVVPLGKMRLPTGVLFGGETARRRSASVTTETSGVRDYAPGDSFNRIHWRSTAKRGDLMVKEYESEPRLDVWLFADFSAAALVESPLLKRAGPDASGPIIAHDTAIAPSTEEYTVVIAASLAQHFIAQRRSLGFAAHAAVRHVIPPERGSNQLPRILEALAGVRSISARPFSEVIRIEGARIPRGTTALFITSSLDQTWIAEVQTAARRGLRTVCILIDPTSFGGSGDLNRALNALSALRIPVYVVRQGDSLQAVLSIPSI